MGHGIGIESKCQKGFSNDIPRRIKTKFDRNNETDLFYNKISWLISAYKLSKVNLGKAFNDNQIQLVLWNTKMKHV